MLRVVPVVSSGEDIHDFLIAESAPLLLEYLSHPDKLLLLLGQEPPNVATLDLTTTAKLALLQQNYKSLMAAVPSSLETMVVSTTATLNLQVYGAWYVAALCLFVAAAQRNAGREDARQELIDKIVNGEINVQEVSDDNN